MAPPWLANDTTAGVARLRPRYGKLFPDGVRSYRITLDRVGRWYIAFAAIPEPITPPGTGGVVGVDRGIAVSAALSTGAMLVVPRLSRGRQRRLSLLKRRL